MYTYAKEKARAQPSASSHEQGDNAMTERERIAIQAQRVWLPRTLRTYQQAFHEIYKIYGETVYNEIWNALSDSIPLNSDRNLTAEHMAAIADFIAMRDLINSKIHTLTTPNNLPVDVGEIRRYLHKIPSNVLQKAFSLGQVLTATNENITNHPRMTKYKDFSPRGWPAGQTLQSVSGMGAPGKVALPGTHPDETIISLSKKEGGGWSLAGGHSSTNLVLHEYGHAIDRSFGEKALMGPKGTGEAGDYLSRRPSFISAWEKDLGNTSPESFDNYYWQGGTSGGAEEAFAEGFSDLYGKTEQRNWPNIKAYLARKMKAVT